ncbi:6664_t:CDS:2, partial [Racocetra fulgida]
YLLTIKEVMEEVPNNKTPNNNHVIGSHVNGDIKSITELQEINSCNSLQTTSTQRQESNDDIILTLDIKYGKDNELPSYLEVIKHEPGLTTCESCETLPAYSCSVFKAGYVLKKDEMVSHGVRAKPPIREFSMNRAEIGLAVDYAKRFHVLRVYVATGYQFLFQTTNRDDSISWIENFQSSVNISSSIDDREMPMFITLPARFQGNVNTLPFVPSTNTRNRDYNEL